MTQHKKSEKTKERIDEVARRLFHEREYDGVTMRDIASMASLPVSVLYYYYDSKDDLYSEVTYRAVLAMFKDLRGRVDLSLHRPLPEMFADLLEVRSPERLTAEESALYRRAILEWLGARGQTQLTKRLRQLILAGKQLWIDQLETASAIPKDVVSMVYEYLEHETINMLFGLSQFERDRIMRDLVHLLR